MEFFIVFAIIIAISLLALPWFLSYKFYQYMKNEGKVRKYIGISIFAITNLALSAFILVLIFGDSGFGPDYESTLIKQNIGGNLLCSSVYTSDFHNGDYDIDYRYIQNNGDTIDIGQGSYNSNDWNKDEQLVKVDNWFILKTGFQHSFGKVIFKNINYNYNLEYNLDDKFIEQDSLWKSQNIQSLDWCCAKTTIEKIDNKEILVKYTYRVNPNSNNDYDKRFITYLFDNETGQIKMTKIRK